MWLERSELAIRREGLSVHNRVEVYFESIELKECHVRGEPDDFALSVVHFDFRFPDGRADTGCMATVRHALGRFSGGCVRITVPTGYQCPAFRRSLELSIEEYYRRRVDFDGRAFRIGAMGAAPPTIGVPVASPACAEFDVEQVTPG